ncbi:MAG: ACP S-malonyltransferase, partial [candidate division Zixibacteria bacterium]
MSKTALLFPGQASQYVGMGRDIFDSSEDVRQLYSLASDEIGEDIAAISFEGPSEKLKMTRFTQPAILLHSLAALKVIDREELSFDFAAGHSLGEYGALAACGALSLEDAIRAVVRRSALMEEACVASPGTMAAILGLTEDQTTEVCEKAASAGVVVPANFNSGGQIVISGALTAVEKACEIALEMGAKRAIPLEVGGAFHSPLMQSARDGLEEFLGSVQFLKPNRPVIANVTGKEVNDANEIRELLVRQITAPVRWMQTMDYLKECQVTQTIEIGPGKVLSGLAKR